MKQVLLVFAGGGLGSALRFLAGKWIASMHHYHFPLGTLLVNVTACLIIGLLVGWSEHKQLFSPDSRLFWTAGFCGGFSTFSAFSNEAVALLQNGLTLSALLYVLLSVVLCLAATFGGIYFVGNS